MKKLDCERAAEIAECTYTATAGAQNTADLSSSSDASFAVSM